jgi:hypothetical protein
MLPASIERSTLFLLRRRRRRPLRRRRRHVALFQWPRTGILRRCHFRSSLFWSRLGCRRRRRPRGRLLLRRRFCGRRRGDVTSLFWYSLFQWPLRGIPRRFHFSSSFLWSGFGCRGCRRRRGCLLLRWCFCGRRRGYVTLLRVRGGLNFIHWASPCLRLSNAKVDQHNKPKNRNATQRMLHQLVAMLHGLLFRL